MLCVCAVQLRRSGRVRRAVVSSLNETVLGAELLEGERTLMRQSQRGAAAQRNGEGEAVDDDEQNGEEQDEEEEDGEEEEADEAELRARRARPARGKSRGGGRRAASEAASDASDSAASAVLRTPARKRARRSSTAATPSTSASARSASSAASSSSLSRRVLEAPPAAEEEHFSQLWRDVARTPGSTVKSLVRAFLASYEAAKVGERLRLQVDLANFLLEAAGSVGGLTAAEVRGLSDESDAAAILSRYEESELIVAGEAPLRRVKKLDSRLRDLLHRLYADLPLERLLHDLFFHASLPSLVAAFSRSSVRAYRMAMSVAYEGMMAGVIDAAVELEKQRSTAQKQAEAAQKKRGKAQSGLLAQLREGVDECAAALESLQALLKRLFSSVFCHRYRDVDCDIRALQLSALTRWMLAYPAHFLHDSYLKYLGWTLHDKAAVVRRASLGGLLRIYQQATVDMVQSLDTFTRRFVGRIEQMVEDVDGAVSGVAIDLMAVLLRLGLLKEEEATRIPSLLWDEDAAVRKATVHFVVADTFGDKGREGEVGEEKDGAEAASLKHQEDLVQLCHLFLHYCPLATASHSKGAHGKGKKARAAGAGGEGESSDEPAASPHLRHLLVHAGHVMEQRARDYQQAVDVLVDGLLPHLPALLDWSALLKLILSGLEAEGKKKGKGKRQRGGDSDGPVGPITADMRRLLLRVFLATARRVAAAASGEKEKRDKEGRETREAAAAALSLFLIQHLPQVLSTFLPSPQLLAVALQLLSCVRLSDYALQRQHASFTQLLAVLQKLLTSSVDWPVLRECGLCWKALVKDSDSYQEEAAHVLEQVTAEWREAIQRLWSGGGEASQEGGSAARDLLDDEEASLSLLALLKRTLALSRPLQLPELAYSSPSLQHIFQALLPAVALRAPQGSVVEQELLVSLLHLLYVDVLWSFTALDRQTPARTAVERLVVKRNDLTHVLHQLLDRPGSYAVQDSAFEMTSELLVLFSGRLQGGVLSELALNRERVLPLSAAFAEHFQQMMEGDGVEQRMEQQRQRAADSGQAMERDDTSEEQLQSLRADLRVQALTAAGKVLCFDYTPQSSAAAAVALRHPLLSAYVFSHFLSCDAETLSLLRATLQLMRDQSFSGLLSCQRHTLQHLFEHHAQLSLVKALSSKFALQHAVQHPSFLPLLLPSLRYAVLDAPAHLPFLDIVLPFIARCSRSDAVELHRQWQAMERLVREAQADREGEERRMRPEEKDSWTAIDRLEEQLNKKLGRATTAAGRALRSVGEGEEGETEEGKESEEVAEPSLLLTPAPQRRTPRSSDSARSGQSILSLGLSPVREAAEDERADGDMEETKEGERKNEEAAARKGRKRGRPQRDDGEPAEEGGAQEDAAEEEGKDGEVDDGAAQEGGALDERKETQAAEAEEDEEGEEEVEAKCARPAARKKAQPAARAARTRMRAARR